MFVLSFAGRARKPVSLLSVSAGKALPLPPAVIIAVGTFAHLFSTRKCPYDVFFCVGRIHTLAFYVVQCLCDAFGKKREATGRALRLIHIILDTVC